MRITADPPSVVDAPWNSICLQLGGTKDQVVTPKDLWTVLLKQAGFGDSTPRLDMRVLKVRAYCLANKRPIRLLCYGVCNTSSDTAEGAICNLVDWPAFDKFAAVGYEYSATNQQIVNSSDGPDKIFAIEVGSPYPWLAYVDLLWRGAALAPIAEHVRFQLVDADELCSLAPSATSWAVLDRGRASAASSGQGQVDP